VGVHILTLAWSETKLSGYGQLPEDSASCERDTDPQKADVLDGIRGVSRLMAKMRRDKLEHIVSGGKTMWKSVTMIGNQYPGQTGTYGRVDKPTTCQPQASKLV
jgi:hypothetical protein